MIRTRLAALVALALMPAAAEAQTQLRVKSTFPEPFGYVSNVREISNGDVIVADPLGVLFARLDLGAGTMRQLGREGAGPAEWRQPDAVFALPGDTSLLVDLGNSRLTVVGPDGGFGATQPLTLGEPGPNGFDVLIPRSVDARGRVYIESRPAPRPGVAPGTDSLIVKRWSRGDAAATPLARLAPPAVSTSTSGGANDTRVRMMPVPYSPRDDWSAAPDGRLAIVRAAPYHVEWVAPDGRVTRGPDVAWRPVRIGGDEKRRWLDDLTGTGLTMSVTSENGAVSMQMSRGGRGGRAAGPTVDAFEWPDAMPAFRAGGTRVAPDGRVWVERWVGVGAPTLYDLFDASGRRVDTVRLQPNTRVVGFGRGGAVYTVRVDEDGLNWLERQG